MATNKKRELFDAEEYSQKMDEMIKNLRRRKPGELVGNVGKNDILATRREELQQLVKDGYSINQIAEAIKEDVFSILPKTITEIIKPKVETTDTATRNANRNANRKVTVTGTVVATNTQQGKKQSGVAGAPAAGSKATFEVKPDTRDL